MTDIPTPGSTVPTRLGVSARLDDGELVLDLVPTPEVVHHGVVRASVLSFLIDAVAGLIVDDDPSAWSFTTDMTVRLRPVPAPPGISARNTILRRGQRSLTCQVDLTDDRGAPVATGAIGFAKVPRKDTDPPKPIVTPELAAELMHDLGTLTRPLREEAGIEVIDPAAGIAQVKVTPQVTNPAGTLQGAMVALLAEAAAEDLLYTRFGVPVVVTDLDLRYLARASTGPVRTGTRLLGGDPAAPIEVMLTDTSNGTATTLAYVRAAPAV